MLNVKTRSVIFSLTFLTIVAGCGGATVMPGGGDDGDSDGGSNGDTISFARDVQPILTTFCATCHVEGGLADLSGIALRLTEAEALDGLIGGMSVQDPSFSFVVPGDSSSSLLFLKVSMVDPPVGDRMPFALLPLEDDEIAIIRDWIDQGAAVD